MDNETIAFVEQETVIGNGLPLGNGLVFSNGLQLENGLPLGNGLAAGLGLGLDSGLITEAGLSATEGFMTIEAGQTLLRYLVECALPPGHSITKADPLHGGTITFDGYIGLAPEWEAGGCGRDCQQWVSACLLARTNALGETISIEIVAAHPAVGARRSQPSSYNHQEAAFYGNLFANPPRAYTCEGKDVVPASLLGRLCGLSPASCGFENVIDDCFNRTRCKGAIDDTYVDCPDETGTPYRTITSYTL